MTILGIINICIEIITKQNANQSDSYSFGEKLKTSKLYLQMFCITEIENEITKRSRSNVNDCEIVSSINHD